MAEVDQQGVFEKKHFSPIELAELWGLSADTIRRRFAHEPGTVVLERPGKRKGARPYKTLKIPLSVALRVYEELTVKPKVATVTPGVCPTAVSQHIRNESPVVDNRKISPSTKENGSLRFASKQSGEEEQQR